MRKFLLCALLTLPGLPLTAIDLTPRYSTIASEGDGVIRLLYFTGKDERRIRLSPDSQTTVFGDKGESVFQFEIYHGATLKLVKSPHSPDTSWADTGATTYRETALAYAPVGGQLDGDVSEKASPFEINDWQSHRFTARYRVPGSTIIQSVTFLNLDKEEQIVLITTAFEKDFSAVESRADALMRGWHEVDEAALHIPPIN